MAAKKTRVLHLEDDRVQTQLFEMLLRGEQDLEHVGAVHECAALLETIESKRPDVLVMDLTTGGDDPAATIDTVHRRFPGVEIVLFTGNDDPDTIRAARVAGAAQHVTKGREIGLLMTAIRTAAARLHPEAPERGASDRHP